MSINENNWFAESMFFVGVHWMEFVSHVKFRKFVYVVHNINHLWVIMWHIFTSTNNTTTILFPTQLWKLFYTYHVFKQCTEKETTPLYFGFNIQ
jgi:hypothetical protein